MKPQPFKPLPGRRGRTSSPASSSGPPPAVPDRPDEGPLTRGFDPVGEQSRALYGPIGSTGNDPRDLTSLLAYGPTFLPYTTAWTDNRIEQVRSFKHYLFVAIDRIASKCAENLPNVTWVRHEGGKKGDPRKYLPPGSRVRALAPLLTHEQLEPVPFNHPLLRLLRDPNDPDTAGDLIYETVLFLLLTGSAYWWLPPGPIRGLPAAIWVVPSHWMWPVMGKDRLIEGWEIRPVEGNYLRRFLPAEEIVHIRKKNPISKLDGFSPLTAGAQWGDIQSARDRAMWHTYRNGPLPTVAVEFDGKLNDPDDQALRRIESKFLSRYAGETRAGAPIFCPPGVKLHPLTINPSEMVFGESGRDTRDNIYELLGYYPGMSDYRGKPVEAETAFCSLTLNPLCRMLGEGITEKVASRYPGDLRVWWEAFRVNDPRQTNEDIKTDMLGGAITRNEIRVIRGREPYKGALEAFGNEPIQPVNMKPGALPGGGEHNDTPAPEHEPEQPALNDEDSKGSLNTWHFPELEYP